MDLIELIREKINIFSGTENYFGLQSVVTHIEVAERHLDMGKKGDDNYFTDVIYRTNQAFEGLLKEAYILHTGNDAENKSPYQIEKYLEQENLLKERVLSLFSNYRMEWRNKSTHDYKLYFSSQEAFLAIISICAFFNILLDQMIEAKAYLQEKEELKQAQDLTSDSYSEQLFLDQVIELLTHFSKDITSKLAKGGETPKLLESEILGMLAAYLNTSDPELEVLREYAFSVGSRTMRVDILLRKGSDNLIVEVKRSSQYVSRRRREGQAQLVSYIAASGISKGILFIPPTLETQEVAVEQREVQGLGSTGTIVEIYPKNTTMDTTI